MRTAMGSHAMGAGVAHYLLILICHRNDVNLGARRKARPDFGHIHLPVIDAPCYRCTADSRSRDIQCLDLPCTLQLLTL